MPNPPSAKIAALLSAAPEIAPATPNIPLDVVFSPIVTGSKSYIEWARKHTSRVEITAANMFSKH
jgi:hypothetical protein